MQIRTGKTRIVLLTRAHAYKLARPKPLRALKRLLKATILPGVVARTLKNRGYVLPYWQSVRAYLWNTLWSGLAANRQEYALSRAHPEYPLAPVLYMGWNGWLIIQPRGERLLPSESAPLCARFAGTNLGQAKHACRIGTQICFFDYGGVDSLRLLQKMFK